MKSIKLLVFHGTPKHMPALIFRKVYGIGIKKMPPRKRNTRAQKVRAKPELKEAEESKNGLSAKEKKEKLERYLQDFDVQGLYFHRFI